MATTTAPMTAEEFFDWVARPENDGGRYELEAGEVVAMPPPSDAHGTICAWIAHLLWQFAIARGRGRVTSNDTGLIIKRNPDTIRGIDVMFFDENKVIDRISRRYPEALPSLVIEVLSPSDSWTRMTKRVGQFLRLGVPLVWVVDMEYRTVTVFRPGGEHIVLDEADDLTGNGVLPDFRCKVGDLFALPGGLSRESP